MSSPQVRNLVEQILRALPDVAGLEAAVEDVRNGLEILAPGLSRSLASELEEARAIVAKSYQSIEILHRYSVIAKRPKWYFGPKPGDLHWPSVQRYLLKVKGWHADDVAAIHLASNEVVSLLEAPTQQQFSCRGLVVGHVQSGKTANMTAVIAKAIDAGYNTIIVLAGLTNKLRYQTQLRLDEDLVQRHPMNWQVLTASKVELDFRAPVHGGFLSHLDKAQVAVIKKNVSPLGQLRDAVRRTLPAVLARLKILVIDDECDQASVNSARNELDMTTINQRIRELLSILPAVSYVGYTATPFANVLINPYRADGQELDDLYPRDFITALPTPARYFGTERLFGRLPIDPEDVAPDEEGLDMIRAVPEEEEGLLQPKSRKERDSFRPVMAESLIDATLYFLGCCATRRIRGDASKHMTMLVHTSAYVKVHELLAEVIQTWVNGHRREIVDPDSEYGRRFARMWLEEQARLPAGISEAPRASLDDIFMHLRDVLQALEFPVENGSSDDRIDYTGPARTYIVVGGSILARGLTLEGLMVSYFLRTANQYDTLLQMGRWFGYRPRYEDLPRIWMTNDLKMKFRALAQVEHEIRRDIELYRLQDLTPMEMAVRIRAIPGLAITEVNKMRSARQCAVSYWGTHRQTFRFEHRNREVLARNWQAAAKLVDSADALGRRDDARPGRLWRHVPKTSVVRFLEAYASHATHADLDNRMLLPFLRSSDPRLLEWNVGIVEAKGGTVSDLPLGSAGAVRMVSRARLNDGGATADIKALMSRGDLRFDCPESVPAGLGWEEMKAARLAAIGQVPLLLLYVIDRNSRPVRESMVRVALDAVENVIGYGIVFPGSVTEGGSFVSVELAPLSADEIEEIAEEEAAQAEAAGIE